MLAGHYVNIRFIETTTILPIDVEIEKAFMRIVLEDFASAVSNRSGCRPVDVFLVNEAELDLERTAAELEPELQPDEQSCHPDSLGIYIPHHPECHRPIIKISPERIMKACMTLHDTAEHGQLLKTAYPALFCNVVVHELAHFVMAEHDHDEPSSWRWLADCFDERHRTQDEVRSRLSQGQHSCVHCYDTMRRASPNIAKLEHVIEESLANALAMRQEFSEAEQRVLSEFINRQPCAYRVGKNWKMDNKALLLSAQSWRRFKERVDRWSPVYLKVGAKTPLERLVDRLIQGTVSEPVDFDDEFHCHLIKQLSLWQADYDRGKPIGSTGNINDFLNGPFGVYWELTTNWQDADTPQRLTWLQQWALNGAYEGIDRYQQALSKNYLASDDIASALACQQIRKANVENNYNVDKKVNTDWRKRGLEEIDEAIARIEALQKSAGKSN